MDEGETIRRYFEREDDTAIPQQSAQWNTKVEAFLDHLGLGYRQQFDATRGNAWTGCPLGRSVNGCGYWEEMGARVQFLNSVMTELRSRGMAVPSGCARGANCSHNQNGGTSIGTVNP